MKKQLFAMGMLTLALAAPSHAVSEQQQSEIAERIKLVGSVCVEGDDSCAVAAAPAASSGPKSGKEIYDATCMACHATGAAGAPKLGDKGAWAARIDKGMETLISNAINGFKGMPAKGTCMSCSDDEIKATVEYMVEGSK